MRYHKAAEISQLEARYIIQHFKDSLNDCVVIEYYGRWFDIRKMTGLEFDAFINDLGRSRLADETAGLIIPH